ncbi:hypothetical protein N8J89_07895 [Crossiella sp. CA-258035]|uniref:RNase H family protein n=1 Tax=Crossiella sp. CA-258035 TaxID=2981138 RepID=UPI0024BC99B6|nr:RNase H family protein [Crossiella sp. CA-258035]WHT20976.1 hypothetical protein N8J89_07895 [Crossiella sp. CA-258035]
MTFRSSLRRTGRHLLGRHSLTCGVGQTMSGYWVWSAQCDCDLRWRGAEFSATAAYSAMRGLASDRDSTYTYRPGECDAESLWPGVPVLRKPVRRIEIPRGLRGTGRVVACDGSLRSTDGHAGWAFVTNAGWSRSKYLPFEGANINGLELMAIAQAVRVFPGGVDVWVLSDSAEARAMTAGILRSQRNFRNRPSWVLPGSLQMIVAAAVRGVRIHVVEVRSKTHPLHNLADRAARNLEVAA